MQEDGATSSTDVTEPVTDFTEVCKTAKESVSVEQEQLLRAAEPDQCVFNVKTQRQRYLVEFTHSLLGVTGEVADDLHRRRQDSDLEDASFDRTDVAAVTEPKEVTLCTVRFGCERFEMWRFGVRSLKCQNETADITSLNTVDWTRRNKTIPRNKTTYSHDSLKVKTIKQIWERNMERDPIERCMTEVGMMIVGAWAGEQLSVGSGTREIIGEELIDSHSWTIGVVLLITVGVGLLRCVCAVFDPHLPTGSVHVTGKNQSLNERQTA